MECASGPVNYNIGMFESDRNATGIPSMGSLPAPEGCRKYSSYYLGGAGCVLSCMLLLAVVICDPRETSSDPSLHRVDVINTLNSMMVQGNNGTVYAGGNGVLVLGLSDSMKSTSQTVAASLLVDDIHVPNTMYPSHGPGGPMCPNSGETGFGKAVHCPPDQHGETGPWNYAQIGVVVGSNMSHFFNDFKNIQSKDWDWGVFYGTDANSVDTRCRFIPEYDGYDCPGYWVSSSGSVTKDSSKTGAAGFLPGNPLKNTSWGAGAGCHFADYMPEAGIDQTDAYDSNNRNLVSGSQCQCTHDLRIGGAKPWDAWVDQWLNHAAHKPNSTWQKWFGGGKAPSFALDFAACWINNPRDMIGMQNAVWARASDWSNQKVPTSNWQLDATTQRSYWGWNEVPVSADINKPAYWDAIFIKLPLAICGYEGANDTAACLSAHAQTELEAGLDRYVKAGYLKVGHEFAYERPGSSVAFLREVRIKYVRWIRQFFCEDWVGPAGKYQIVNSSDGCYLDYAAEEASSRHRTNASAQIQLV